MNSPLTSKKLTKRQLEAQAKRLERALRWALGELGEFPGRERGPNDGAWWWRTELQRRAGLRWDHRRMKFVPKEVFRGK